MVIKSLRVENVRSHEVFECDLSPNVTVLTGDNGSGKTTLLESIAIGLEGKSFRGSDNEILRSGANWLRIDLVLDEQERVIKYQLNASSNPKQFIVDDKKTARLPKAQKHPVVLFEPDDLRLIHGSPSRRRKTIDQLVSQIKPEHRTLVGRYEKILRQRNKLLKNFNGDTDSLFAWNVSLAKYGAEIIQNRIALIDTINQTLEAVYRKISDSKDEVSIKYSFGKHANIEQYILTELEKNIQKDALLGNTSVGPHRHDVEFRFNGKTAESSTSRGETRTIILAMKFIEVDIIEDTLGKKPIVLLDDVFSELDESRQSKLMSNFVDHQIIMTSVAAPASLTSSKIIEIKQT